MYVGGRNFLIGLTVALSGALCAGEIVFIGADTANPTNFSSLALKGLRIEGAAGKTITLGGASVLTLGESGYKGNASLTLRCPVAIAAPQTRNLGEGVNFTTYSSISGTADLCISNFLQYVVHHATLGYGAKSCTAARQPRRITSGLSTAVTGSGRMQPIRPLHTILLLPSIPGIRAEASSKDSSIFLRLVTIRKMDPGRTRNLHCTEWKVAR